MSVRWQTQYLLQEQLAVVLKSTYSLGACYKREFDLSRMYLVAYNASTSSRLPNSIPHSYGACSETDLESVIQQQSGKKTVTRILL